MTSQRLTVELDPETWAALEDYQRRNADRFDSLPEAAHHLLTQTLIGNTDAPVATTLPPKAEKSVVDATLESIGRAPRDQDVLGHATPPGTYEQDQYQ